MHSAAATESLQIMDARVPAVDKEGGDLPLTMTIRNEADSADDFEGESESEAGAEGDAGLRSRPDLGDARGEVRNDR